MFEPSRGISVLVAASVGAAMFLPAAPAAADIGDPVTVISLTDEAGAPTPIAVGGLQAPAEAAPTPAPTSDPATSGADEPADVPAEDVPAEDVPAEDVPAGDAPAAEPTAPAADAAFEAAGVALGGGVSRSVPVVRVAAEPVSTEGIAVLTEPVRTEEFVVAGLTWQGDHELAEGVHVFVRVLEGADWQEWSELEPEQPADTGRDDGAVAGTEPYVSGGAEAVQVQITGDAAALPAELQLSLVPSEPEEREEELTDATAVEPQHLPTEEPVASVEPASTSSGSAQLFADAAVTTAAADAAAVQQSAPLSSTAASPTALATPQAAASPSVVSRSGWSANERTSTWRPSSATLRAAVVHHTAGSNTYTWAGTPGVVRGIHHYHAVTRGWGDIGYNFLVDKWGRVFEGRRGSLASAPGKMTIGAHASGFNTGTLGISAMGDYTKVDAPQAILDAMADVIAWKFADAGIEVDTPSGIISPGTAYRSKGQNLPRIFAHRDVGQTTCPGNDIYGRIPALSAAVDRRMPQMFHLNNSFDTSADVKFRYGAKDAEILVGDWDGDGVDTVAAREGSVFKVNNSNRSTASPDVTFAYGRPEDTVLVGDWDGDGKDTLAVRRGAVFHVRNSVTTGPADKVVQYGRPTDQVLVGDWDGDRRDTFAVRRGRDYFVKNSIAVGSADEVVAYGRPADVVLVGDWDGNRRDTFAVRRGSQYFIKNSIRSGNADLEQVYGRWEDLVIVGDWDGDRKDTLGVRRP